MKVGTNDGELKRKVHVRLWGLGLPRVVKGMSVTRAMLMAWFALFAWTLGSMTASIIFVVFLVDTFMVCLASKDGFKDEMKMASYLHEVTACIKL